MTQPPEADQGAPPDAGYAPRAEAEPGQPADAKFGAVVRRRTRPLIAVISAAVVAILFWSLFSAGFGRDTQALPSGLVGAQAPALAGATLAGGRLDLGSLRGNVVLVNVWAAWCAPCRQELPVLVAAQRGLRQRGLRVVGIDTRDGARQARELLASVGGDPGASVVDPGGRLAVSWGTTGVPETFLIDADGVVRARQIGAVTPAWVDNFVVPLLRS